MSWVLRLRDGVEAGVATQKRRQIEVAEEVARGRRRHALSGRSRRRRGGLFAAALAQRGDPVARRLARAGHQFPVDDRVRAAAAFDAHRNFKNGGLSLGELFQIEE